MPSISSPQGPWQDNLSVVRSGNPALRAGAKQGRLVAHEQGPVSAPGTLAVLVLGFEIRVLAGSEWRGNGVPHTPHSASPITRGLVRHWAEADGGVVGIRSSW